MSTQLDSRISTMGLPPPDPWLESYGVTLPLDLVVARDKSSKPVSYAGDYTWDLSAYGSPGARAILYFGYWKELGGGGQLDASEFTESRIARVRELQFLMCKLKYPPSGRTLAPTSLRQKFMQLRLLARFAEGHGCYVRDVLERRELLDAFIPTVPDMACSSIVGWLKFLDKLDPEKELGFVVAKPLRLGELKQRAKRYNDSFKQRAPLPTRIFSQWIVSLSAELDDIEAHKDALLAALHEVISYRQMNLAPQHRIFGPEIILRCGLTDYLTKRGFACEAQGIDGAIGEIFQVCALQIHTFSGMRKVEAKNLPFHCMLAEKRNGRRHALLIGNTTKLNGGRRKRTKWVTTERDGFRAIRLAQAFSAVIYDAMELTPSDQDDTMDRYPLFISTNYLHDGKALSRKGAAGGLQALMMNYPGSAKDEIKARLLPIITAADIGELEDIDPFRAWHDEADFAIGKPWPLTTHQLRRSLALYARASGCVRLSSLRRQLQQLTNEMAAYYGNGCAFAKNLLADDPEEFSKHIALEWQSTAEEAMVLAMVWDVLRPAETLHGGAGNFYNQQRKKGTLPTREQVEREMNAGTLYYDSSHPLGGCTDKNCTKRMGLNFIGVTCATENCKNLVGMHSRVIRIVQLKRAEVKNMDQSSLTYRMEKEELDELEKVEVLWRPSEPSTKSLDRARRA